MTAQELKERYTELYNFMSDSRDPKNMKVFGGVMTAMMHDIISSSPSKAEEYISRLESIKWKNYLTRMEAETIVSEMTPPAPWSITSWSTAMKQHDLPLDRQPCYNMYALYATMNMIMSDSEGTLAKYIEQDKMFKVVYDLAVDKLTDEDGVFNIRVYFGL